MPRNNWPIWAALILVGIVALALIGERFHSLDEADGAGRLAYLVLLLAVMGGGTVYRFKAAPGTAFAQFAIWVALFAGLTLAYTYKGDFIAIGHRLASAADARGGTVTGAHSVSFPLAVSGHYEVTAELDGVPVSFYVDTGASAIVLTPQAAERLGFKLDELAYNMVAETANGYGRSAPIRIAEFKIGPIVMYDVPAHVNLSEMSHSLLGMEILNQLSAMRIENGTLTLEQ